jgi:osmotically-inducible protein OsmY
MKTDLEIQRDVIEELQLESYIKSSDIGVSVKDGVVTLTGFVDSFSKKRLAESIVFRVEGVKAVAEDIIVRFDTDEKVTDPEIAQLVVKAIQFQNNLPEEHVKVKVENGWVTITGDVDWNFEKTNVNMAIKNIPGVKGLTNSVNVTMKSKMNISTIKWEINSAFHKNALIDANSIVISGVRNKIILRGLVRSNVEKEVAERIAAQSRGVLLVDNRLKVVAPRLEGLN